MLRSFNTVLIVLALLNGSTVGTLAVESTPRPSIVLCILDDMDYNTFGFRGHPDARTPNLDRLARHGTVVRSCITQARCAPSLACILTGRLPHENGRYFNYDDSGLSRTLDPGSIFVKTLVERGGYRAYAGGKWWNGFGDIEDVGFEAGEVGGPNHGRFVRADEQSHLFGWIDTLEDQEPFFLWWAPLLPHLPHNPPERFLDQFDEEELALPLCLSSQDRQSYRTDLKNYLATIAWVDEEIGRLFAKICKLGRLENTLFITIIDNGWSLDCEWSKGYYNRAGMESPVILTFPGMIPSGETRDHLAHVSDLFPTILDYAGLPHDPVSGQSLRSIVENPSAPWRRYVVDLVYPARSREDSAFSEAYGVSVRSKNWSYGRALRRISESQDNLNRIEHSYTYYPNRAPGEEQLFRLLFDPDERLNLVQSSTPRSQDVLFLMRNTAEAWLAKVGFSAGRVLGRNTEQSNDSRNRKPLRSLNSNRSTPPTRLLPRPQRLNSRDANETQRALDFH